MKTRVTLVVAGIAALFLGACDKRPSNVPVPVMERATVNTGSAAPHGRQHFGATGRHRRCTRGRCAQGSRHRRPRQSIHDARRRIGCDADGRTEQRPFRPGGTGQAGEQPLGDRHDHANPAHAAAQGRRCGRVRAGLASGRARPRPGSGLHCGRPGRRTHAEPLRLNPASITVQIWHRQRGLAAAISAAVRLIGAVEQLKEMLA